MGRTLAKPWNRAAPGTVITTETEEAYKTGALLVDPARFTHLEAEGFFEAEPEVETAEESTTPSSDPSDGNEETSAGNEDGDVRDDVPPTEGAVTVRVREWDRASVPADTSEPYPPEITDTRTSIPPRKGTR